MTLTSYVIFIKLQIIKYAIKLHNLIDSIDKVVQVLRLKPV